MLFILCGRSWVQNPDGRSLWTIMKFKNFDFYLSDKKNI
jgi:hypothetical protein